MFDPIDFDLDTFDLTHDAEEEGEALEAVAAILGRPVGTLQLAEVLA
jgi:hypothetical protein